MSKIILIYANCVDPKAKGDFSFAGNIAKDLVNELMLQGQDIDVVLTSTLDGLARFEALYGTPVNGRVVIEDMSVGVCALELFDAVKGEVVAFIEANRCKHAAADIVKRVLSPDSKFLFIGAANQPVIDKPIMQQFRLLHLQSQQANLYPHFDADDIMIGSSGIGSGRLGLPDIKTANDLPALTDEQSQQIPNDGYGFMYLNAINESNDLRTAAQYIAISELNCYVLVGAYASRPDEVKKLIVQQIKFNGLNILELPQIHYHQSLPNGLMRHMVSRTSSHLVLSAGVMSALEAMNDRKLTYYQTMPCNVQFVASYLHAVRDIVSNDTSLIGAMPQLVIELSDLLFADKPLAYNQVCRTKELVAINSVASRLIETNQKIIQRANGTLAGQLLSFIGKPNHTQLHRQCVSVCQSLRKDGEQCIPVYDQALRRAAAWGRLFELKVLIKSMSVGDISKPDISGKKCTALHWAVLQGHVDCARSLILAGAQLDIQDSFGKTPLHYAVQSGARATIQELVENGAALDIADTSGIKPCDGAEPWIPVFIQDCLNNTHDLKG